jgi:hypothetical protein
VSSNLFVAEQYLALVVAQAANLRTNACAAATGAAGTTVNIVEVASGHGVLSILIARLLHHRSFRERVDAYSATSTTPTAAAPAVPAAPVKVKPTTMAMKPKKMPMAGPWITFSVAVSDKRRSTVGAFCHVAEIRDDMLISQPLKSLIKEHGTLVTLTRPTNPKDLCDYLRCRRIALEMARTHREMYFGSVKIHPEVICTAHRQAAELHSA